MIFFFLSLYRIKSQKNQIRQFFSDPSDINQAKFKISSQNLQAMMKMVNTEEGLFKKNCRFLIDVI